MEDNKLKCYPMLRPTDNPIFPSLVMGSPELGLRIASKRFGMDEAVYYHLYFLSDREIKSGDYMKSYAIDADGLYQSKVDDKYGNGNQMRTAESDKKYLWKIEASTDPSLSIPLIPINWMEEEWVKKQGNIKEVYINTYTSIIQTGVWSTKVSKDQQGCVIIIPTKDSWNRDNLFVE